MLTTVNSLEKLAIVRLLEFLSDGTPWNRSLWGIGVVLAIEEYVEACAAMRHGHLGEGALKRMTSVLHKRVGVHPGFSHAERQFFKQQLQPIPRVDGAAHFGIRDLATRVSADYLSRWSRAIVAGNFAVEHFARSVAAHLLDAGFSAKYLHDFIKGLISGPDAISLAQLCDQLQTEMQESPKREFEVLLAFASVPALPGGIPAGWLQGASVTGWLKHQGFDTRGVRAQVAMLVKVDARDSVGAAHAARNESDRYAARALIATGKPLNRLPTLWVKGSTTPSHFKELSRGVGVKELHRADRIFASDASHGVDAALELLAHLEESSAPAAVAGGWGAIEGLLADPSDRASAADNLATLVTCSFPRAELTLLSYQAIRAHPDRFAALNDAHTNRERSQVLASMILSGRMTEPPGSADQAAVARMKKLLASPYDELQTIREAISESLHRLYRQRNLILHGGRLDSVALSASLRTVAKLVGAGMDRITHGHYVQGLKPLELVAKANLNMALISRETPLDCLDLLEMS